MPIKNPQRVTLNMALDDIAALERHVQSGAAKTKSVLIRRAVRRWLRLMEHGPALRPKRYLVKRKVKASAAARKRRQGA